MSTKPQRQFQQPRQAQPQVDLSKADTVRCDDPECNNVLFIQSTIIKRLSAIVSPTGKEALVPIDVYSCGNCGKVPKTMLQGTGLDLDSDT
ncbi:hypothetical protein HOE22_11415, partial [Candidatus Woesearchaeota archaeon]|jgi:hypothetical protein|nr:hypothetical protein [Candidatus Woesearchaeota archaeon]MBT7555551.1 hypothetical protein [Candidatus Woesearchaeota archaeon]